MGVDSVESSLRRTKEMLISGVAAEIVEQGCCYRRRPRQIPETLQKGFRQDMEQEHATPLF